MHTRAISAVVLALLTYAAAASVPADASYTAQRYFLPGEAVRLSGANRYETSIEVSEYNYGAAGSASGIILASGETFADSIAAAPLSSWIDAPIFLTKRDELPGNVASAIRWVFDGKDDAAVDAYIIGGTGAISVDVEQTLQQQHPNLTIKRLSGANRTATSLAVAEELVDLRGGAPDAVFVVSGNAFADALSVSGAASDRSVDPKLMPILLNSSPNALELAVAETLASYTSIKAIYVAGGTSAVSEQVFSDLNALAGAVPSTPTVVRYAGGTRYGTSAAVAERFYGSAAPASVGIASGENFADAVLGGADSGKAWISQAGGKPQAFLLVQQDNVPADVLNFLSSHAATLESLVVYGGTSVVSDAVAAQVLAAL